MSRSEVAAAGSAGQALVDMGTRYPLMVFSGNSVDYLIVSLAVMTAGVPAVSVTCWFVAAVAGGSARDRACSRRAWRSRVPSTAVVQDRRAGTLPVLPLSPDGGLACGHEHGSSSNQVIQPVSAFPLRPRVLASRSTMSSPRPPCTSSR